MVKNIIVPICDVYKKPNDKSILETQFLFGEKIKVLDKKKLDFCKSEEDSYKGWVKRNLLEIRRAKSKIQDLFALV